MQQVLVCMRREYLHIQALNFFLCFSLPPSLLFNIITRALISSIVRETNSFLSAVVFFSFLCVSPVPFFLMRNTITNAFMLLVFSPDANFSAPLGQF